VRPSLVPPRWRGIDGYWHLLLNGSTLAGLRATAEREIVVGTMAIQDVLAKQLEFDRTLLAQLGSGGDNPGLVHKVEHHFVAGERDPLVKLSEYARGLLFEPSDIVQHEHEGSRYWAVDLVSRIRLEDGRVSCETALMRFLAIGYRVEYDGWGTYLEKG
jgi:regulator of RNase E activity RraB